MFLWFKCVVSKRLHSQSYFTALLHCISRGRQSGFPGPSDVPLSIPPQGQGQPCSLLLLVASFFLLFDSPYLKCYSI